MPDSTPLVAVVMGSTSDWDTMKHAVEVLERFGVPHEHHVVSAHRTPVWMAEFASGAEGRGIEVIIAGAGGAAHLPGMVAAHTIVPVLGVPVQSAALQGLDSLLSIVQMPGGVPVGVLAIGKPGATNAGLLAVSILSNSRPELRTKLRAFRDEQTQKVRQEQLSVILPGAALGVLGSGQLGRMFTIAARRMGYRVHTFSPDTDTPTGQVADVEVAASYDDHQALRAFARDVSVVTFEFENVPSAATSAIDGVVPVRPSPHALHVSQQRAREKTFLAGHGFPTVPFAVASTRDELSAALTRIGTPAVVKTAESGYDGKGQHTAASANDADCIWGALGGQALVVEKRISLQAELSVIAARGLDGDVRQYSLFENRHSNHILDLTTSPAAVPAAVAEQATQIARGILEALEYVGVLCIEFFLSTDGALMVNELAPRPHNSGHLTFDAAVTSQFEQQVRAICGLPLGSTELLRPAAMANLLGDLWAGGEPDWAAACRHADVKLHLYGKVTPNPRRKMGHLTAMGRTVAEAQDRVIAARDALLR